MNRKPVVLLAIALALPLAGCGKGSSSPSSGETSSASESQSSEAPTSISESEPPTYSEESVQIHYYRPDGNYAKWAMWLWGDGGNEGSLYPFNGQKQANGAIASYKISDFGIASTGTLGLIVRNSGDPGSWTAKDPDGDRFAKLSSYPADDKLVHHIYLKTGDSKVYYSPDYKILDSVNTAYFKDYTHLYFETSNPITAYKIYKGEEAIKQVTLSSSSSGASVTLDAAADLSYDYSVEVTFEESKATLKKSLSMNKLFNTAEFNDAYTYDGDDLGATYSAASTTFKVWSPFAKSVELRLYDSGTPTSVDPIKGSDEYSATAMTKGEKGVYGATVSGDLSGKYYTYSVTIGNYLKKEVVDPYAKSAGVSGLRGMVVDWSKTNPDGWDGISAHQVDCRALTVYETHVADITSSETWTSDASARSKEKTFAGAALTGTSYTKGLSTVKTGFDHIKELGVNAVELLPIFDQANDETKQAFNWGYNPLNYNVLEGSYSSDPYDGYARIKEFKSLVKAYNEAGINIIMDVVYNHVNGERGSNWDVLVPGYFYRYEDDGTPYNGSGCGNEVASELPMARKFIVDSSSFWAKEYKLGGFRFDLMALIDMTTMEEVATAVHAINPTAAIFGEPWTGGASGLATRFQANQANGLSWKGYGGFNDQMRDGLIAGGLAAAGDKAWVTKTSSSASTDKILGGIRGQTLAAKNLLTTEHTVNYASCHDNYTLYDRCVAAKISDETALHYMPLLANSVVLTSNGISFMLSGEEMLRSKGGDSNSYASSYATNALDYSRKVDYADVFTSYQKLIAFKEGTDGLQLTGDDTIATKFPITVSADGNQICYDVKDTANSKLYKVIHNDGYKSTSLPTQDLSGYSVYLDTRGTHTGDLTASTSFLPYETLIAVKPA